jgi:hypothetical protein
MPKSHRYQRVSPTDLESSTDIGTTKPIQPISSKKWQIVGLMAILGTVTAGIIATLLLSSEAGMRLGRMGGKPESYPISDCGTSAEEARKRGCRFEMHNFAWVPPQCYDEELGREWDSHTRWEFSWAANDSSATNTSFVEQCRAGDVEAAWVPWSQHMAHCSFILKKYLRSVMFDRPMDNWTSSWHHNEHCTNMMAVPDVNYHLFNSLLHLKFPDCDYSWKTYRPESREVKATHHG